MNKDSVYKSERLELRGIALEDAETIVRWRSDPANYKNFFDQHPLTMDEHLAWFDRYLIDDTRFDFMIIDSEGTRIGTVGLSAINHESCEISYMIGNVEARGKGLATEVVETMSNIAFEELGVQKVWARILSHNVASARVIEGGGFEETERVYQRSKEQSSSVFHK